MQRYENADFMKQDDLLIHVFTHTIQNRTVDPHCHEFVEFVYIFNGTGKHEYQGKTYAIAAGDVLIIEPEAVHAYHVGPQECLQIRNILFHPSFFAKELGILAKESTFVQFYFLEPFLRASSPYPSHLRLLPNERISLQLLIDQMAAEYEGKEHGYKVLLKTKLMECFIYLSRCYLHREQIPVTREASEQELMEQVTRFVHANYDQSITLEKLGQMCGMSESGLRHKFKAHTGLTLLEYRNEVRIGIAKQLLQQTDWPISEIALEIGFNDISFFNRVFKQRCQLSPRQYRMQMLNPDVE
ncbi:MAG: hypothetical protein K0R67_2902 [Paenibacillus sp.]|nr:hypothetical protein [Paenibacillus sp.]